MTQTELANRTGLTSAYISQIENGKEKAISSSY
ncbi:helix-turn-helix domain-containing protein [Bacillus velezensis]